MASDQIVYAYVAKEETYPDEAVIIQEGSKTNWVYVILEGHVKIRKKTSRGQVTLGTLKEGAFLGEMVFLAPNKEGRSVSAVAADGPVRVGLLDSQQLMRDYESVSPRLRGLIRSLIKRLRAANKTVCDIVVKAK